MSILDDGDGDTAQVALNLGDRQFMLEIAMQKGGLRGSPRNAVRMAGRIPRKRFTALLLAVAPALSACASITVESGVGRTISGIGIYRIHLPDATGSLLALDQTGIGLGWSNIPENAAWLGFRDAEWVIADPSECQLLIIIKSAAQAENAGRILEDMKGEGPCIVDHTGALQR